MFFQESLRFIGLFNKKGFITIILHFLAHHRFFALRGATWLFIFGFCYHKSSFLLFVNLQLFAKNHKSFIINAFLKRSPSIACVTINI